MRTVFISYRREDSDAEAGRLYDALARRLGRGRVFRDVYALRPGEDYATVIDRTITAADVVLVLIGRQWLAAADADGRRRFDDPTDLHRQEIASALRHTKLVIPVLLDDVAMPSARELPEEIAGLSRRNALELSDSRWDYDVSRLVAGLGDSRWPRARTISVGAAAVVLAAGVAATVAIRAIGEQPPPASTAGPTPLPVVAALPATLRPVESVVPVAMASPSPEVAGTTGASCADVARTGTYKADTLVGQQAKDWSAAGAAANWLLLTFGCEVPPEKPYDMFVPAYMDPKLGLLDGRGTGIVAVFRQLGLNASNATVSFDDVISRAGRQPLMIGGANWARRTT